MKYLILFLCLFSFVANAQEYKPKPPTVPFGSTHYLNHEDYYSKWNQPGTSTSCCNKEDCDIVRSWKDDDGFYHYWLLEPDGKLNDILVDPKTILKNKKSPDGNSHACARKWGMNKEFSQYCFVPGDGMF